MRFVLYPVPDAGHEFERGIRPKLPQTIAPFVEMRCGGRIMFAPHTGDAARKSREAARERPGVRDMLVAYA